MPLETLEKLKKQVEQERQRSRQAKRRQRFAACCWLSSLSLYYLENYPEIRCGS